MKYDKKYDRRIMRTGNRACDLALDQAKSKTDLENLIKNTGVDISQDGDAIIYIAKHLAIHQKASRLGPNWLRERLDWLREIGKAYDKKRKGDEYLSVTLIAVGCIDGGNDDMVEELREKHGAYVDYIAQFYAICANHTKVEEYREKHKASLTSIFYGYAMGGNHEKLEQLAKEDKKNVNDIAYVYARRLDHKMVWKYYLNHEASNEAITNGYIAAGDLYKGDDYVIYSILDNYLERRKNEKDDSGKTIEYRYNQFFVPFQKSFTEKQEAVIALKKALHGEPVDLIAHLSTLRNGELGEELRSFIKSGRANGLFGIEVNTVTEFVNALQATLPKSSSEFSP